MKFKYRYRQGYNSENYLIQFLHVQDADKLVTAILDAVREIYPLVKLSEGGKIDDEYLLEVESKVGEFSISRQAFDLVIIFTEEKNLVLEKVCDELFNDARFEMVSPNND